MIFLKFVSMFCVVRYIYCSLAVLFLSLDMYCQECRPVNDENDSKLDYYELICDRCLSMKDVVLSGGSVSRDEASGLIRQFLSLNKEIKAVMDSLTESQKIRFERISRWFSSGKRPVALDDSLELEKLPGLCLPGYAETCYYRCDSLFCNLCDRFKYRDDILHTVSDAGTRSRIPKIKCRDLKFLITVTCSLPLTYGLRIGVLKGKFGGYVAGKTDFRSVGSKYSCTSDGLLDNGMPFWGNGEIHKERMSVSAGLLFRAVRWLDIYAGLGYGYKKEAWQDIDGNWASVSDLTYKGIAADAGVIASLRRFSVSLGVSTVAFHTAGLEVGLGINF